MVLIMYSEILSFKDVFLGLAQDYLNSNKDVEAVLDGIEDYCVSTAFKYGLGEEIPKRYNDWFSDSDDIVSDAAASIDDIVGLSFFDFEDYPYISRMLKTIYETSCNTLKSNKVTSNTKKYFFDEDMFGFVFKYLPQFRSYIESPLENKDFEKKVQDLIEENPSSIIKSVYFMGTKGIVEKEILRKLDAVPKKKAVIYASSFQVEVGKYIKTQKSIGMDKFLEGTYKLPDVFSRMKHFGLIDYDEKKGNCSNFKITDLGTSAYDVIKYSSFKISTFIPKIKKPQVKIIVDSEPENELVQEKVVGPVVKKIENKSVKHPINSDLVSKLMGPDNLCLTKKRVDAHTQEDTGGETDAVKVVDADSSNPVSVVDGNILDEMSWMDDYKGRKFPYGISEDDGLSIALDPDKEDVLDLLDGDRRVSNEFLCLLSTLVYNSVTDKKEIAEILGSNGDLSGMLSSLDEIGILSGGLESLSYQKAIECVNYGISALMAYNLKLDDREKGIFGCFLESSVSNKVRVL